MSNDRISDEENASLPISLSSIRNFVRTNWFSVTAVQEPWSGLAARWISDLCRDNKIWKRTDAVSLSLVQFIITIGDYFFIAREIPGLTFAFQNVHNW